MPTARAILLAAVLAVAATAASASPAFEAMLTRAEDVRSADPPEFRALLGQMDEVARGASASQRERLEYLKAYGLAYDGHIDEALPRAQALFEKADDIDVRVRAGALIVHAYAITRDYGAGLRVLDETLAMEPKIRDRAVRHHLWSAGGVIQSQVGEYARAREFAEKMLADEPSPRTRCFAGALRVEALYNLGELARDIEQALGVVGDCAEASEPVAGNFTRLHVARQRLDDGDAARALVDVGDHMKAIRATGYPRLIGESLSLLAQVHLALGHRELAERHAEEAIGVAGAIEYSLPLVAAERVLYESALQRGDTAAALDHLRRHAAADKAYLDVAKTRELAVQMVRQETWRKNQTIALLNERNRVLGLEQQVSRQEARNTQLVIVLLAMLLAFIGYFAWKTKRMQVAFRRLAETDALTGVSNRHHFTRRAAEALEYCEKAGKDATIVMFDLDEFKSINDRFGHGVGDWVLEQVAVSCGSACRQGDLFGRLGGEEFAFLMVGADAAAGRELAEACRRRLHDVDTGTTGRSFRVTASFGVVDSAGAGYTLAALLARADAAMYRAKEGGRDQIVLDAAPRDVVAAA